MPDIFTPKQKVTPTQSGPKETSDSKIQISNPLGIFASFCKNPAGVTFRAQESDEIILLFTRKHFITNLSWILTVVFFLILPFFIQLILTLTNSSILQLPFSYLLIIRIFYFAAVFTYAFIEFITWYYNISLVTNIRIVDIDYSNVVFHDVAITKVDLVEDVNYSQTGFFPSLFKYGDVFVQTAGEAEHFDFLQIPNPQGATELIANLIGKKKNA